MIEQVESKLAFNIITTEQNSFLVDVRTQEEFSFVGVVDDSVFKNKSILLPWLIYPNMDENPEFANNISDSIADKEAKIFFLCRTGARSNSAAQFCKNIGYQNCYNIANGFEGDLNNNRQRGLVNGWKAANLGWKQS